MSADMTTFASRPTSSVGLLRFVNAVSRAHVDFAGELLHAGLSELTVGSELVHQFEALDFLPNSLSSDLAPIDFGMSLHPFFELAVDVNSDCGYTENYGDTESCVFWQGVLESERNSYDIYQTCLLHPTKSAVYQRDSLCSTLFR